MREKTIRVLWITNKDINFFLSFFEKIIKILGSKHEMMWELSVAFG